MSSLVDVIGYTPDAVQDFSDTADFWLLMELCLHSTSYSCDIHVIFNSVFCHSFISGAQHGGVDFCRQALNLTNCDMNCPHALFRHKKLRLMYLIKVFPCWSLSRKWEDLYNNVQ